MLTVLIADDEKKVGMLVKELIDWEHLPLQLIDMVQDGETAYEIILEKKPDIVITDIRMPKITGLEMIEKVVEQKLNIHFIVISGYRYFEYAQKALKYGVEDYLLKPIDEVELNRILTKVCENEAEKQAEEKRIEDMQQSFNSSQYLRHKELLNMILNQKGEDAVTLEDVNKEYGVRLDNNFFKAIYIKVDRNIRMEKNPQQEKLIMQKLMEMVERNLKDKVIDMVLSERRAMGILLLLNYREEQRESLEKEVRELFFHMKEYIGDFNNYDITMGVSEENREFSAINRLLEMAREAINARIYQGTGKRIDNCFAQDTSDLCAGDIVEKYEEELNKAVTILEEKKISEYVEHCFKEVAQTNVMACEIYELGTEMVRRFARNLQKLFGESLEERYAEWNETVEHCKTVVMMEHYLASVFSDTVSVIT